MQQGDKVTVDYYNSECYTSKIKTKKITGEFIKDYGNYIQVFDRFHLRKSIMKNDILKIVRC